MNKITATKKGCKVTAYIGDAKTLLAFDISKKTDAKNLAGFTIRVEPKGVAPFFILNSLRFKDPSKHAQDASQPANSSLNAPIHKFRWVHVPGSFHQGTKPFFGPYKYTVTPRFFDGNDSLLPLDQDRSVEVTVDVRPFKTGKLALGFTRGFTQSQAFVHHFGLKAVIRPKQKGLVFNTSAVSGKNAAGQDYTFDEEYEWLGFTAQDRIFEILGDVEKDNALTLKVFAYDLNEPNLVQSLVKLAKQGRVRVILDKAALHHDSSGSKPEDEFETLFKAAAKKTAEIMRGRFGRYAHDKVLIVCDKKTGKAKKVLTGSTNFSVTGLYVNSNHVLVFDDSKVAEKYSEVFEAAWTQKVSGVKFTKDPLSQNAFRFKSASIPETDVTFSPHHQVMAKKILDDMVKRIQEEETKGTDVGSVLFAVMETGTGTGPVYPALRALHTNEKIFSYGISDTTNGISLYRAGSKKGVLVTGKPGKSQLPPPFDQVPGVGLGHQVHHKFVVCGFNRSDAVVYCGSSNLAEGGEKANGDNLLVIYDRDVATVFAIEALALVDHFDFLDRVATKAGAKKKKPKSASKPQEAENAGWFLSTDDDWVKPYYDSNDLHYADRVMFGG
jgi:hypothetical protein